MLDKGMREGRERVHSVGDGGVVSEATRRSRQGGIFGALGPTAAGCLMVQP